MGRVARYKKVKKSLSKSTPSGAERISINDNGKDSKGSIDYFDRVGVWGLGDSGRKPKKRSLVSIKLRAQRNKKIPETKELYDLAFTDGDDFDLNDLVGSIKKEQLPAESTAYTSTSYVSKSESSSPKPTSATTNTTLQVVDTLSGHQSEKLTSIEGSIDVDEEKLHKKLEAQVKPKTSTIVKAEGRMPGESKRAYSKRVKQETRQIIQKANQLDHNPEKRQKKKEFLSSKKKGGKKRKNISSSSEFDDDGLVDHDDIVSEKYDLLLTGEQAVAARERATRVQFGEQAERPPIFQQLPRGATNIGNKKPKIAASLSSLLSTKSDKACNESEHRAMDLMRRKVQVQYAEGKARRRINRDFHL